MWLGSRVGSPGGLIPVKEKLLIGLSENRVPTQVVVCPADGGVGQELLPVSSVLRMHSSHYFNPVCCLMYISPSFISETRY